MQIQSVSRITISVALVLGNLFFLSGQTLTESNLPIVLINTNGVAIPDEPKIQATMQIIDNGFGQLNHPTDTPNDFDGLIGIEIRGQTSAFLSDKKPYGFETLDENGEEKNVKLLGMPKESDWVLLAPFSDKSLMRDVLAFSLGTKFDAMAYTPRMKFVEVVLNGVYQGVYVLGERIKRDNDRVNIQKNDPLHDPSGGFIIKVDKESGSVANEGWPSHVSSSTGAPIRFLYHYPKPEDILPAQSQYIQQYMRDFEDVLKGSNFTHPQNGYTKYLEINSFIDFMLMNEVSRNVDGYRISTFLYKDRDSIDSRLHMGPIWDFNIAFGNANYCEGGAYNGWAWDFNIICGGDYWTIPSWWARLRQDTNFLIATQLRWKHLRQTTLSDAEVNHLIDSLETQLGQGAATRNFQKWPVLGNWVWPNNFVGPNWPSEVDYLRSWTIQRLHWMDNALAIIYVDYGYYDPKVAFKPRVYPNPASNGQIHFEFYLRRNTDVSIRLFDAAGRFVADTTVTAPSRNGEYHFTWNRQFLPGMYTYQINTSYERNLSGKIIIQ